MHSRTRLVSVALALLVLSACGGGATGPFITESAVSISVPGETGSTVTLNGSGTATTFAVSELHYTGTFTATSSNVAVVTVAAGSSASTARRSDDAGATATSSGSFTLTAVGGGTANVTVSDENGHSSSFTVGVTTAGVVVNTK